MAKAREAALLSSWGGGSRDAPELLKAMAALAAASKACGEAVASAVDRKEEAGHIRAEVLGQLDSQQERLNQVRERQKKNAHVISHGVRKSRPCGCNS